MQVLEADAWEVGCMLHLGGDGERGEGEVTHHPSLPGTEGFPGMQDFEYKNQDDWSPVSTTMLSPP